MTDANPGSADSSDATPASGDIRLPEGFEPEMLAGREYDVTLSYTVDFHVRVIAGPEDWQAEEEARLVATPSPNSSVDPADWDLVHKDITPVRDVWMDDPEASKAVDLDEPHVPSEDTYWDDSRHFGGDV